MKEPYNEAVFIIMMMKIVRLIPQ